MPSIIRATTTNGLQVAPDNSGSLQLQTNGTTTALTIDTSQNVGIGTTSPTAKLDSYGTKGRIKLDPDNATVNVPQITFATQDNSNFADGVLAALNIRMNTSGSERMRIDSSGNVGIANTSPAARLDISAGSSNAFRITTDNTNTTIFSITRSTVTTVTHTLDNTGYKIINGGSGGLYLGFTGTSWVSLSDERFKTDLKPIENAAEKVSTLRAVTGRFKTDEESKSRSFLIAQDIQDVFPEAVDTSNPEQLGVSYTDTIPLLVAAIQEQQTIINDLKARIETLEAK